ncbi:MAG: hypothetical protein IJN90_04665 [Bacilli bacterium]|nr:hypothetical protein [Bacilli bacterium]
MMQETDKIVVDLKIEEENDFLIFNFDNPIKLNLNTCSNDDLKKVFCEVLKLIVEGNKKTFKLEVAQDYTKELFKDVFTEYIKIINEEINKIKYE